MSNKNGKKNLISHLDHVTSRQLETEEVSREFPFRGLESTVAFSLEGGGKKEKKEERKKEKKSKKEIQSSFARCLLTREPRRFSGLLVIEIQPTLVPPSSFLPYFFFSFLSPPTQNHHPTAATFPPIYQHLKSIFLSTPPRPSFRLRNGIETRSRGTRDPTQRRDYTRGRVDTNHHPFELENPRIRFLLSGQLLLQESNHACLITLPFNRFSHSIQSEITAESLLAFDLIKNGGVGPRFANSTRLRFSREFLSKLGGLLGVLGVFLGLVGIILWTEYTGESMKPCIRCVTRSR